jgi:hypothetical protein
VPKVAVRESAARPGGIHQPITVPISEDQRVEVPAADGVSVDEEKRCPHGDFRIS